MLARHNKSNRVALNVFRWNHVSVVAAGLLAVAGLAATPVSVYAQATPAKAAGSKEAGNARTEDLPITRITLYRSGVASVQRRGMVDGDAKVQLRFNTDQINDILKSMVVLDLSKGQGQIDSIGYASREPLAKRLASFGIDLSDQPSMGTILARLRGAKVSITLDDGKVTGSILGGENRMEAQGDATQLVPVPYLNVLTQTGIRSLNLNKTRAIELLDPDLAAELNKALSALAEHRADRTKMVDVNLSGAGAREVVIAYVQEAPVWKASYRLVLPDGPVLAPGATTAKADMKAKESAVMQGWAIVENTTDEDWQNVRLSLVSGRPVSFTMDLYEPLYMPRPEVAVPTIPGVLSRAYDGGEKYKEQRLTGAPAADGSGGSGGSARLASRRANRGEASAPGSPAPASVGITPENSLGLSMSLLDYSEGFTSEDMATYGARSQAAAKSAGEVFQYELERPITVERQRSAMLPILNSPLEARRVSIFSASEGGTNPMRGIEVINTSENQLMPGPISVFDGGSYAGDAQIGHVPAGDTRLLAYAVDLDVTTIQNQEQREAFQTAKIVKGVCELTFQYELTSTFEFTNKDKNKSRTIIVETPKYPGYELIEPKAASEVTPNSERFEIGIDADSKGTKKIVRRMVASRSFSITQMDSEMLVQYSRQGKVSKAVLDALSEVQRRSNEIVALERVIQENQQRVSEIEQDQARIRANMNSIDRASQLYSKYMAQLTTQEDQLVKVRTNTATTRETINKAREALDEFVNGLSVD